MPRESLRDHLNGNELDLSLSNLTEIPVKEIAAIPKATRLDLSCNSLISVPSEFCNLTLLVKLDLSKNQLTSLPSSIGKLQKLQHLDLYNNKLSTLPVSMCHLKSLRWLDVKSNPFSEGLLRVAGDCLDDAQCKECAKNVVSYMKKVESEHERQRQKALNDQREQEAKEKAKEEGERKKQREKKKLEKERKRRDYEAQREAERRAMEEEEDEDDEEEETDMKSNGMRPMPQAKVKKGVGCCGVFISALLGLLAVMVAFCIYCSSHPSDNACILANVYNQQFVSSSRLLTNQLYTAACDGYSSASDTTIHYYSFLRESALNYIDTVKSKLQ